MTNEADEMSAASRGSQPVMAIVNSDEAALRIIVRQQRSEIERLKDAIRRIADQNATLSACNGSVTVTMDAALTDAEREAIREACDEGRWYPKDYRHIHTLLGLLDRPC